MKNLYYKYNINGNKLSGRQYIGNIPQEFQELICFVCKLEISQVIFVMINLSTENAKKSINVKLF